MNRRTALLLSLAIAVACAKEKPAEPPAAAPPQAEVRPAAPQPAPAPQAGSYDDAVRLFRIAPKLSFNFDEGEGTLERPRLGMESVKLHITKGADRGNWTASVKPNGVIWTKDGKHTTDVPASLQRLYQFLVFFPDPQKREGTAQRVGDHYEFTNAIGGDRYVVRVGGQGTIEEVGINSWSIRFR